MHLYAGMGGLSCAAASGSGEVSEVPSCAPLGIVWLESPLLSPSDAQFPVIGIVTSVLFSVSAYRKNSVNPPSALRPLAPRDLR